MRNCTALAVFLPEIKLFFYAVKFASRFFKLRGWRRILIMFFLFSSDGLLHANVNYHKQRDAGGSRKNTKA